MCHRVLKRTSLTPKPVFQITGQNRCMSMIHAHSPIEEMLWEKTCIVAIRGWHHLRYDPSRNSLPAYGTVYLADSDCMAYNKTHSFILDVSLTLREIRSYEAIDSDEYYGVIWNGLKRTFNPTTIRNVCLSRWIALFFILIEAIRRNCISTTSSIECTFYA